MTEGPLEAYRALRREGTLSRDPSQELAAEKLQSLHNALAGYRPGSGRGGLMSRLRLGRSASVDPPQGLYMYGDVGRGKSMLMDLFFDTAPVERKQRVHFHAFMRDAHQWMHRWREDRAGPVDRTQVVSARKDAHDPIPAFAADLAERSWLLCFDEFHVTNIADAMILGRLFEALFAEGVVVLATSNWPPDDLYKGGLQRDRFLPFIEILKNRLDVLHLAGETDHRMARLKGVPVYYVPLGTKSEARMARAWRAMTDGETGHPTSLTVQGRALEVPRAFNRAAWFSFDALCEQPLGAADYLVIAEAYRTVLLSGIPKLSPEDRNAARRFMTLIDALYEGRVTLICSAAAAPHALYPQGDGAWEFERTVSRLVEMQAEDYLRDAARR